MTLFWASSPLRRCCVGFEASRKTTAPTGNALRHSCDPMVQSDCGFLRDAFTCQKSLLIHSQSILSNRHALYS
ncbi:hypothetical protein TELCIR_25981 [Teladorsagia circumcincta]|uniref:Uncharacterized protein n=1 Tax=Teladorsagia circumcincta TaxID=45464 RepID=A0A2G9T436_TELCI|nr:hypothetical protein TELCIR_25981 [Teladorsagia circumcincta]